MLFRIIGFFLSKSIISKLGWVAKLGSYVKVHASPLIGGACFGIAGFTFQQSGIINVNLDFIANQTLLDSICSAYSICGLNVAMGTQIVSSLLLAIVISYAMERFYMAESPKSELLVKINSEAEKAVDIINEISGSDIEVIKDENKPAE